MFHTSEYPAAGPVRTFDVEAISVPIVYNKYGDYDPNGLMYALAKDSRRIREKAAENFHLDPPQPYEEVRPLVLRANVGDEIRVNFRNRLNRRASMHVQGLRYSVLSSDGANVGQNPDTTTDGVIQYIWYADREGVFLFSDLADPRGSEEGTNVHGLFGAIIVEAAESEWFDPVTGEKLENSTVKTVEHVGGTAIKTTQAAAKAAQKAAVIAAKTAHRSHVAAQAAAKAARKAADYTARAAKAIAQAMQELISVVAAGSGTVLILVIVLIVMCFAGMMLASDEDDTEILPVSEEVKAYEPIIQKYAKEHGIPDYVLLIEAVMMLESGGRGTDPMQCSECNFNTLYPHTPGSITDPEYSINVGIQNLADCLQIAECESPVDIDAIRLALQGYNYGQGYITWAMNKYGGYSKANAIEFSLKTAEQLGWDRYGNMDYVPLVLQYYPLGQIFYDPETVPLIVEVAASQIGNVGGEPYWRWYGFTERVGWCACFVSWCTNECGYIDAGTFPRFSGPEWGVYWFRQHGQWVGRQTVPTPGMIIFYDWDNPETGGQDGVTDHVGIVSRVENGIIYTIEGNTVGDSCQERSHPVGDYQIFGYGVPQYIKNGRAG